MGNYLPPQKCFITDIEKLENKPSDEDLIEYYLFYDSKRYDFSFPGSFYGEKNKILNEYKWIFKGLVLNHKWPIKSDENILLTEEELERIANEALVPRTPKEKMDNLLLEIHKMIQIPGRIVESLSDMDGFEDLMARLYFREESEFKFYLYSLRDQDFIKGDPPINEHAGLLHFKNIRLTITGLNYIIEIQESGKASNRCFVAMSFSDKAKPIRKVIRETCSELGLQAILIDETHFDSEVTINDAMIAEIKKSKFCIADFTEQKDGVYFEAGYALGRGLKVIYTCRKDWWKKTHFDTKHFPHIIYEDLEKLKEQLKDKIEAWIL